jgi:hypothetical protein
MTQSLPISTPINSPKGLRKVRNRLHVWLSDLKCFLRSHRENASCKLNPLYGIPQELLQHLRDELPDWLTPVEWDFEDSLARLLSTNHSVGIFHGRPVTYRFFDVADLPEINESLLRQLKWDQYFTLPQIRNQLRSAGARLDPLRDRLEGFVGWLNNNPVFLAERDAVRTRWNYVVEKLGFIPPYPVATEALPENAAEALSEYLPLTDEEIHFPPAFIADLNAFYDRWQIHRLATWDLPEPREPNLSGLPAPSSVQSSNGQILLQLPVTLKPPANYPLRAIQEEIQRQESPQQLTGWLAVQEQSHGDAWGYRRFLNSFRFFFYRDVVLASRYGDRFAGRVEKLDSVFARFLGDLSVDSAKKLRIQSAAMRLRGS